MLKEAIISDAKSSELFAQALAVAALEKSIRPSHSRYARSNRFLGLLCSLHGKELAAGPSHLLNRSKWWPKRNMILRLSV